MDFPQDPNGNFIVNEQALEPLNRDQLQDLRGKIEDRLDRVKGQISKAKADLHITGEYSDPDWFQRAETAKRIMGRQLQKIQPRQGELKRQRSSSASFEKTFFEVCQTNLPPEVFLDLKAKANRKIDEQQLQAVRKAAAQFEE